MWGAAGGCDQGQAVGGLGGGARRGVSGCVPTAEPWGAGGGDPPGPSFGACVCSWLFAWHVVWLSAMQLRHYLFIGTLNPLLDHLASGDPHQGRARPPGRGAWPGAPRWDLALP